MHIFYRILLLGAVLLTVKLVAAQHRIAQAKFNFPFHNPVSTWPNWMQQRTTFYNQSFINQVQAAPFNVISTAGTVCNNTTPTVINYNDYYNRSIENEYSLLTQPNPDTAGRRLFDSVGIENIVKSVPANRRFRAEAGKPFQLTVQFFIASERNSNGSLTDYFNSGPIPFRPMYANIGTCARPTENSPHRLYNQKVNFTQFQFFSNQNLTSYTFEGTFMFERGSTDGYIVVSLPISNYRQAPDWPFERNPMRYEQFVIPYVVSGVLDKQVATLGYTTEPQIPYLVLHDPPGDGSVATLSSTTRTCRSFEETYATDESQNVFGTVKLGVKGSVGFIATFEYEIFAEFSAGATFGNMKMGATSRESCITISNDLVTSNLDPEANTSDLFVGYGSDMWYGVMETLQFDSCPYRISKNLIFTPKENSTRQFVYTQKDILNDIEAKKAALATPGLTARDSANAMYQIDVWNKVLAMNEANKQNPDLSSATQKSFGAGTQQTHSKTIDVTETNTIAVEHYIAADAGLLGVVNIAGSGFSAGYKFTTNKRFGSTGSASSQSSQTIAYTLNDDDAGDLFNVRIGNDRMYGTPVFQLQTGSKSSCPYEGGAKRDDPQIRFATTTADTIVFPNVTPNAFQSFDLNICNNSTETRAYRLRLKNNVNNAVVTVGGNAGPEFISPAGINLTPKGTAGACVTYKVDVRQLNPSTLSFPNMEFELYPICDDGNSSSVFATVNYGNMVRSIGNGNWNNINTWDARRIPQPTDNVIINNSHRVEFPASIEMRCNSMTLQPGAQLVLPPTSKLTVKQQ